MTFSVDVCRSFAGIFMGNWSCRFLFDPKPLTGPFAFIFHLNFFMSRSISAASVFSFFLLSLFACKNDSKTVENTVQVPKPDTIRVEPTPTEGAATYQVTEGTINWMARKAIGGGHEGTIKVESGEVMVNQGKLLKGNVKISMNSIEVMGMKDPGEKRDLESHLKDSDFFEARKFPIAEFKFDEVLPSNIPDFKSIVAGELTIKGKTNAVNIPVKFTLSGDDLTVESSGFSINRTEFGINFNSSKLGTVKDKIIQDNVLLRFTLKATKK